MIKFLDLQKVNAPYETEFRNKFDSFLKKGWYVLGDEVTLFEQNFAHYCGSKFCVGVGNGLDALTLIFKAYIELGKMQKGDEVIVPANTYIASILAILQADLIPVLVEPSLQTYNLNPDLIPEKITSNTKAIVAVHLYGQLADMEAINSIAKKNNLLVIEDAAQAHGAVENSNIQSHTSELNSKMKAGNLSDVAAFSFYPGKNLGALGDGGAVVTDDKLLDETIRQLRNYGSQVKYYHNYIGVNSRLDELQAAFLNVKLTHLDSENDRRRQVAKRYLSEIKNEKLTLPFWDFSKNHVFHLFIIRTENRLKLQDYLKGKDIETMIHYPVPPHKQKALKEWNSLSFPITEKIHEEVLSLPISAIITDEEISYVIEILNQY